MTPSQINDLRRRLGLSQEAFAHTMGVSYATVSRWVNGRSTPPQGKLIRLWAMGLDPPQTALHVILVDGKAIAAWPDKAQAEGMAKQFPTAVIRKGNLVFT